MRADKSSPFEPTVGADLLAQGLELGLVDWGLDAAGDGHLRAARGTGHRPLGVAMVSDRHDRGQPAGTSCGSAASDSDGCRLYAHQLRSEVDDDGQRV